MSHSFHSAPNVISIETHPETDSAAPGWNTLEIGIVCRKFNIYAASPFFFLFLAAVVVPIYYCLICLLVWKFGCLGRYESVLVY